MTIPGTTSDKYLQGPIPLLVNGETLFSKEVNTQGDPLGMTMYAIRIQPLIKHLKSFNTQQIWYADDSTAGGNLENLRAWWNELCRFSPNFGYYSNSRKTRLLIKPRVALYLAQKWFLLTPMSR